MSPFQSGRRDGFERRDERNEVKEWLGDMDRRQGPRRFEDREHAGGERFGSSVAERNPTLHPVFAGIFAELGL